MRRLKFPLQKRQPDRETEMFLVQEEAAAGYKLSIISASASSLLENADGPRAFLSSLTLLPSLFPFIRTLDAY